jgi:pantoate--beta-alanine ligase
MGALHDGHLALVRAAKKVPGSVVVVSIFVNPLQFGPGEDFDKYPRPMDEDLNLLRQCGVEVVFAPRVDGMYPDGMRTMVQAGPLGAELEGAMRPSHFAGMLTVVLKLLQIVRPDRAFFGEKDYQQLQVIRRMARDLDIPVAIEGCATVREHDGLAMSSRNAYLSADQRRIAARLNHILHDAIKAAHNGDAIVAVEAEASRHIVAAGFTGVDYISIRDAETLAPVNDLSRPARILAAAWIGKTRLIDNMAV